MVYNKKKRAPPPHTCNFISRGGGLLGLIHHNYSFTFYVKKTKVVWGLGFTYMGVLNTSIIYQTKHYIVCHYLTEWGGGGGGILSLPQLLFSMKGFNLNAYYKITDDATRRMKFLWMWIYTSDFILYTFSLFSYAYIYIFIFYMCVGARKETFCRDI